MAIIQIIRNPATERGCAPLSLKHWSGVSDFWTPDHPPALCPNTPSHEHCKRAHQVRRGQSLGCRSTALPGRSGAGEHSMGITEGPGGAKRRIHHCHLGLRGRHVKLLSQINTFPFVACVSLLPRLHTLLLICFRRVQGSCSLEEP